jgi:hypothetical protein
LASQSDVTTRHARTFDTYTHLLLAKLLVSIVLIEVLFRGKVLGRMNFIFSKAFDNWTPAGPVLVSSKVVGELPELDLKTWWNGKLVQENNSKNMIFNVAEILSAMSVGKCNLSLPNFRR